ncbi:MAG TPA: hypothetical protein VFV02_08300 [Acidimicrobiales bacterium]|nr:hypothetical protein [Acidimicrobiales bacterium]
MTTTAGAWGWLGSDAGSPVKGNTGGSVVVVVMGTVVEVVVGGAAFTWWLPPQLARSDTPAAPAANPERRARRLRLPGRVRID